MGCNCKNEPNLADGLTDESTDINKGSLLSRIVLTSFRFIGFLIALVFTPIILLVLVWFMFKMIVLNEDIDMKGIVTFFANKIKSNERDEDEEEDFEEEFNEDDYIMEDMEVIR